MLLFDHCYATKAIFPYYCESCTLVLCVACTINFQLLFDVPMPIPLNCTRCSEKLSVKVRRATYDLALRHFTNNPLSKFSIPGLISKCPFIWLVAINTLRNWPNNIFTHFLTTRLNPTDCNRNAHFRQRRTTLEQTQRYRQPDEQKWEQNFRPDKTKPKQNIAIACTHLLTEKIATERNRQNENQNKTLQ